MSCFCIVNCSTQLWRSSSKPRYNFLRSRLSSNLPHPTLYFSLTLLKHLVVTLLYLPRVKIVLASSSPLPTSLFVGKLMSSHVHRISLDLGNILTSQATPVASSNWTLKHCQRPNTSSSNPQRSYGDMTLINHIVKSCPLPKPADDCTFFWWQCSYQADRCGNSNTRKMNSSKCRHCYLHGIVSTATVARIYNTERLLINYPTIIAAVPIPSNR